MRVKRICELCKKEFERELNWTLDTSRMGFYCSDKCVRESIKEAGEQFSKSVNISETIVQTSIIARMERELLAAGELIETLWSQLEEIAYTEYSDSAENWIKDKEQLKLLHSILDRQDAKKDDWKTAMDALDNERLRQIADYKSRLHLCMDLLRKANKDNLLWAILDDSDFERLEELLKMEKENAI